MCLIHRVGIELNPGTFEKLLYGVFYLVSTFSLNWNTHYFGLILIDYEVSMHDYVGVTWKKMTQNDLWKGYLSLPVLCEGIKIVCRVNLSQSNGT